MIPFILAYDERDTDLGHFFEMCAFDVQNNLMSDEHRLEVEITSQKLTEVYMDMKLSAYTENHFVFLAYSHGNENNLLSPESYLNVNSNLKPFKNTLFYTFSCSTGVNLGNKLIENGCIAFVGYKIEACIVTRNEDVFVECANFGLKIFIAGENVSSSLKQMKDRHTEWIDKTYNKYPLVASVLRKNRDGLVLHGDKTLKISQLKTK